VVGQGHFPPAATPPRDVRVQRGAHHPRARCWVLAYLPPRHPRAGESLCHQILGQVAVTHVHQDDPQTVIPGGRVELSEVEPFLFHIPFTRQRPDPFTPLSLRAAAAPDRPRQKRSSIRVLPRVLGFTRSRSRNSATPSS
jgi:hypothetical protein